MIQDLEANNTRVIREIPLTILDKVFENCIFHMEHLQRSPSPHFNYYSKLKKTLTRNTHK